MNLLTKQTFVTFIFSTMQHSFELKTCAAPWSLRCHKQPHSGPGRGNPRPLDNRATLQHSGSAAIHIPVEATVPPCRVPSSGSHCVAGSTWTTVHLSCGCVNSYYLISYYTKLNHSYHIMLYYTTMSYLSGRLVWLVPQERDQEMAQKLLLRLRDCSYQIYSETN